VRHRSRPYRHLRMSRRWLPSRLLGMQTATGKQHPESKDQRLRHNPNLPQYIAKPILRLLFPPPRSAIINQLPAYVGRSNLTPGIVC
jgi:hypothetical protein